MPGGAFEGDYAKANVEAFEKPAARRGPALESYPQSNRPHVCGRADAAEPWKNRRGQRMRRQKSLDPRLVGSYNQERVAGPSLTCWSKYLRRGTLESSCARRVSAVPRRNQSR